MTEIPIISAEEQKIRKKAEEKPISPKSKPSKPPQPSKEMKMKEMFRMIIPERERVPGVPVIPSDPCCGKLCKTLNDEIDFIKESIDNYTQLTGAGGRENKVYRNLLYRLYSLEDHREDLKEINACRCVETASAVSIMLPLIQTPMLEERKSIPIKGPMYKLHPLDKIREYHRAEKSITPPTNSCCPESCKSLNNNIEETNKILDDIELKGGPESLKNPRFEALTYKALALQNYRLKLKNICNCVEQLK